jgi:ribonuclease T1
MSRVLHPSPRRWTPIALLSLLLVVLSGCGGSGAVGTSAAAPAGSAAVGSADQGLAPPKATTSLPPVQVAALPPQAVDTLRLIRDGGPFPYPKDGVTFSNREGLLPRHPSGWYREYTVVTPGSSDRGARRIIGGQDGARFYTDDHYASFREVVSGSGA